MRTSNPLTLFDSKQINDSGDIFWDTYIAGGADTNYAADESACTLAVSAAGDTVIRQTFTRWNYQPGKSQLVFFTGALASGNGVHAEIGYHDENDGAFFRVQNDSLFVVIRNSGVETAVHQGKWNVDRLNGSGPSGITIDPAKVQIGGFDIEWLGVGRVRAFFVVDGIINYVHEFNHANIITSTYMTTPNLPVRYFLTTTDAAGSLLQICSAVISEGGVDGSGYTFNGFTDAAGYAANTADSLYAVLGVTLQAGKLDATVRPRSAEWLMETSTNGRFYWARNPTIANTFTCSDVTASSVQLCKGTGGATPSYVVRDSWDFTYGGGLIQSSGSGSNVSGEGSAENTITHYLGSTITGIPDTLVLVYEPFTNTAIAHSHITWQEQR